MVEDYKYPGLRISKKRNLKKDIHHVSCQSTKVIFALKQCLFNLQTPPVNVALHLFNSIIKPILCYGCEIWGFTVKEEIERIEVQYLNYILHLPKMLLIQRCVESLGNFLSIYFWKENIIKYWCRVNSDDIPKYLKLAVNIQHGNAKEFKIMLAI